MTDYTGYSRRSNTQRELERVAITAVDPVSRTATGVTRIRTVLEINCAYATGDTITTPAVGEQWYIERLDMEWRLYGRIPFNDATLNIEPEEGQVSVGSASGPLELNGTEIRANGTRLRLNGAYYRDDGATLLRSTDGEVWEPIFANASGNGGTAGVLQMLAHRLADIPVTPEVTEYLAGLSQAETDALTDLAEWADGLQESIGGGWDALCDNPFFSDLRDRGTGNAPLDKIVSGFQDFANDLTRLLFCQFEGDVTPTALSGGFTLLQDRLTGDNEVGDFLRGLQDLLGENSEGNLLTDALSGLVEFFRQLFDFFFCASPTSALNPVNIINKIDEVFDPLKTDPFLQGLASLVTNAQEVTDNLMRDAVKGATEFFKFVTDLLLCKPIDQSRLTALRQAAGSTFTPAKVVKEIDDFFDQFRNNTFLTGLQDFLEDATGNLLQDAVQGATQFFEFISDLLQCNLTPQQVSAVAGQAGSAFTPAKIVKNIDEFFDNFRNNPFLTGLQGILGSNAQNNLLKDAIDGATEFVQVIFGVLTCDPGALTKLLDLAGNAQPSAATPVNILASLKQTFVGPDGTGGLLNNAWVQIFNNVADRQGTPGNLISRIAQGFSDVTDFIFDDVLGKLFPNVNFRNTVANFPNGSQDWLDDLDLAKLLDPFGLGQWFQDNIFRPVLKSLTGLTDEQLDALIQNPLQNIGIFFGNIRKFFGEGLIGNWLNSFGGGLLNGSFNPLTALQTFISDVLVEGIETLWDTLVDGLTNISNKLVKALTGQPISGVLGDGLKAIKDFFSGFGEFNPATGANPLLTQLVRRITGDDGKFTLDDLANFFDPTFVTNIFKDIVEAITTSTTNFLTGPIKALADFFDFDKTTIGSGGGIFGGIPTLLNSIVEGMIGSTVLPGNGPLAKLTQLFSGVTLTGGKSLLSQLGDRINEFGDTLGINSIVSAITGVNIDELENSYLLTVTGSPTGGTFTLSYGGETTAPITYSTTASTTADNIEAALAALTPIGVDNVTTTVTVGLGLGVKFTIGIANTTSTLTIASTSLTGGTSPAITIGPKFQGPLEALTSFFTGFSTFNGATGTTLLQQILQQAGSDIAAFVSKITGIPVESLLNPLEAVQKFFEGLDDIFDPITGENNLVSQIVSRIIPNGSTLGQLNTFFTNLRGLFGFSGTNPLADVLSGDFLTANNKLADAAARFVNTFLSKAGTGTITNLTKIPGEILAVGINNIENLITTLTGGTSLTQFTNFFTNLRKFLNIGTSGNNVVNFFADPASFSIPNAVDGFIKNIVKTATAIGEIPAQLISAFSPTKITGLIEALTGKTTGAIEDDLNAFFGNFRKMLNIGGGTGQINLLNPLATTGGLQENLFNFVSNLQSGINAFITKSGLGGWLGATGNEINNFFTNLTKFFKIGEFKLAPNTFDVGIAAGNFIEDIINQATNFLINPLKVLGVGGTGTLSTDLTNRPLLSTLLGWVTGTGTTNALDTFFTNIKSLFGGNIDLVNSVFNPATARQRLVDLIADANETVGKLAKQADLAFKAGIDSIVQAITGITGATSLNPISTLFSPLTSTGGSTLLDKLATVITGGVTSLGDFFAGLGGGTATGNSLVHRIVSSITGNTATPQGLQNLGTFFGNFSSSATTLVGKFVDHITGLVTNGLSLTQFFSGFNGAATTTDSLAHKISQSVTGGFATTLGQVDNFFKNIRTFLGIGTSNPLANFFADATTFATNLNTTISNFITGVLQKTGISNPLVSLIPGENKIPESVIPGLPIDRINDLITLLTGGIGTSRTDLDNFFKNIRTFLGGGTGFLNPTGSFNLVTATENFISNILKAPSVGTKLVTLNAQSLLDTGLIPDLGIGKIENLAKFLTGSSTAVAADVEKFFTNLRTLFGGTNFLATPNTGFDFIGAANSFITNVLSKASATVSALIPSHAIANFDIPKINNLIGFITGATGTAANDSNTLRNFFSGFDPFTGTNSIVNQITKSIFGTGGTLSQLQTFFGGLGSSFNPTSGSGNLVHQVVQSITGKVNGALTDITNFLGIGTGNLNPFTGSNSLINQIVTKVVPTGSTLTDMNTFFANLRNLFGTTNFLTGTFDFAGAAKAFIDNVLSKVNSVTAKIPGLAIGNLAINQIIDLVKNITGVDTTDGGAIQRFFSGFTGFDAATGANNLINQFVAKITGSTGQAFGDLTTTFNNLRNFLGFNPTSTGDLSSAVNLFFSKINTAAAPANRLNLNLLANDLSIDKVSNLVNFVTNGNGAAAADLQNFFTNLRNTLGVSFVPAGGGLFNAAAAQKVVHDVVSNINSGLGTNQRWATQAVTDAKAAISDVVQRITGVTGSGDLSPLTTFFSGLQVGSGGNLVSQFVQRITNNNGSTLNDLNTTFANLRNFLGFNPVAVASPASAVNSFFATLNANPPTIGSQLELDLLAKEMGIEKVRDLADYITGGAAPTSAGVQTFFNNMRNFLGFNPFSTGSAGTLTTAVDQFFSKLNTVVPGTKLNAGNLLSGIGITQINNLVSTLTGTGSTATDLNNFFTNLRSTFNVNFLPGTTFDATAARRAIHDFVSSINAGLASSQRWATQAVADAKAAISDIVQRITGVTGAGDLSAVGTFFSGLQAGSGTNLVAQFVSRLTNGGSTLTDLNTFTTNLRGFLGFDPFSGFGNLTNAVSNFFNTINTTAPWVRLNSANLLSNIGMNQINEFITYVTGSSTNGVAQIQTFFNTLRNFLGFNPASNPDLGTAVNTFFGTLNTVNPGTKLNANNLLQDIGISKVSNLVSYVTGQGSAPTDIQNFFDNFRNILGGVNPLAAASTGVPAQSALLFNAMNAATNPTPLQASKVGGIQNSTMSADMRGVFNNVVLGLSGSQTTATGNTAPTLDDIFYAAKGTNDSVTTLADLLNSLENTSTQTANSGNFDQTNFPNFSLWNNGGLTYSGIASGNPQSAVEAINGQAVWKSYGGTTTRSARAVFNRTRTSTNYQKIGIAFASKPMGDWGGGANPGYNYILGRANNASGVTTEYVFAKFSPTTVSIGYTTNGGASETMFQTVNHSFSSGSVYFLECGTSGGQSVYRLSRGDQVLINVADARFDPYINETHRYAGFMMTGTWNGFWINEPGAMASFSLADNTPAPLLGSGFRRYRNATTQAISGIGSGNQLLPGNFFNSPDYTTPDYAYDSTTGKVTVSTEGWYQVVINLGLVVNTLYSEMAPLLYKNGVANARGGSVWGTAAILGGRSPSQCAGAFHVYLKSGEYIQPGYWHSTADTTGTLTGDAAGHTCYMQVTFMNRSTTA